MDLIKKRRTSDLVSESIADYIIKNNLKPGDKLPSENELSKQLGIGRTSVREGIKKLETLGLTYSRQGDGVYLKEVTIETILNYNSGISIVPFLKLQKKELKDLLSFRLIIEPDACKLAADNMEEKDMKELIEAKNSMVNAIDNADQFIIHDMKFHKVIINVCDNTVMVNIFKFIEDLYTKQQSIIAALPNMMDKALNYHEHICKALKEGDGEKAADIMRQHLKTNIETISKNLSENFKKEGE